MIEGNRSPAGFFTPGESLSAGKLNVVADMASRHHTTINVGIRTMQGPFGTVYDVPFEETFQTYDYPFKVSVMSGDTAGSFKVFVRAGTVNSYIPKVLGGPDNGKYLDTEPAPYLEMTSASSDNKYVILRARVSESGGKFFPNDTDVYLVDSLESLADSNTDGHILIASIALKKESGQIVGVNKISQFIYSSQGLVRVAPGGGMNCLWSWTSR